MTGLDKKKSKKSKKNNKKNKSEESGDVLERVMDSIEMAGASLDFFEESSDEVSEPVDELDIALDGGNDDLEVVAADSDVVNSEVLAESLESEPVIDQEHEESPDLEAAPESEALEMDADTENMDLLDDDSEAEFIEQSQAYSIIESLLFSSDRPLGLGTFKQVFKGTQFKTKEIKKALDEMQSVFADPSRGVSLEEVNGGWQLRTKVDNMDFLRKLAKARPFKLSGPALEVLAIIAYKQPLVKSEVDQIRGVESGHLVRALMEKHLVNFQGKSELPGKPMQYGTTKKFLEIFGLRNLRELPSLDEIDQLLPDGIGLEEEAEKLSDVTDKMSEDYAGNYSEGEEELLKIQGTLEAIDTSSEFFEEEKRREKERRDRDRARDIREALDVGEDVDGKDQKWLLKYDERIAEEAELAAAEKEAAELAGAETLAEDVAFDSDSFEASSELEIGPATEVEAMDHQDLIATGPDLTGELSALTAQSLVEPEVLAQDNVLEEGDEQELDPFAEIKSEEE